MAMLRGRFRWVAPRVLDRERRRIRSTRRLGVMPRSRRALCWHRPPVLLPRGATRAKLCKCCQGQTPQNFDRVLAAACLYRDMLSCQTHLSESAMMAQHSDVGRRRRLQKPYQSLRACAYPWKLQDYTLDHQGGVVALHREALVRPPALAPAGALALAPTISCLSPKENRSQVTIAR